MKQTFLRIFIFLIVANYGSCEAHKPTLLVGTNLLSQLHFPLGGNLCQLMKANQVGFTCLIQKTNGEQANSEGLKEGLFDVTFLGKEIAERMYKGEAQKGIKGLSSLRLIMPLYKNQFIVIVNPQSNIGTFNDLKGKKIDIGRKGSESYETFKDIMKIKGWTGKDFDKIYASDPFKQKNNLLADKVDAIVLFEGNPNSWVFNILASFVGRIISLDAQDIAHLNKKFKNYVPITLDAKIYPNNPYAVQTFGTDVYLVTTQSTSLDIIYTFLKTLDENMYEFKKTHPVLKDIYTYNLTEEKPEIPLHVGVERYLIERGIL